MITREAYTSPVKLQVNNTGINTISVNDASFSISNPATNQLTIQVKKHP